MSWSMLGLPLGVLVLVSACTGSGGSAATSPPTSTSTVVYLVRHAEKAAADGDPPLTDAGRARAQALVAKLADAPLAAVYATEYLRTQQTVRPAAAAHGLTVQTVPANDVAGLVGRLKTVRAGRAVLAAGHTNTLPEVARALGVAEALSIPESAYGDLFVIRIDASGTATLERDRFDP